MSPLGLAFVALSFVFGALWRREFGGWRPFGGHVPRAVNFVILGVAAGLVAFFTGHGFYWSPIMAIALTMSYAPAHGPDSNVFSFLKNDWVEYSLRYGIMPGLLVGGMFFFQSNPLGGSAMIVGGILAGLAQAYFRWVYLKTNFEHEAHLTWLPIDSSEHSIVDGISVYGEFFLGAFPCAAFTLACLLG